MLPEWMGTVRSNGTILLVDDDRDRLQSIEAQLVAIGFDVIRQRSVDMAIKMLRSKAFVIDLIVAECGIEGMKKLALYCEALRRSSEVPMIVTAGDNDMHFTPDIKLRRYHGAQNERNSQKPSGIKSLILGILRKETTA